MFEVKNLGTLNAPVYASTNHYFYFLRRQRPALKWWWLVAGANGKHPTTGLTADANGDLFGALASGATYELHSSGFLREFSWAAVKC